MTQPYDLSLSLKVSEIDRETKSYELAASTEELSVLTERFELIAFNSLTASVDVRSKGEENGIFLEGTVKADLVQRCITSLGEVPETIDTPFSLLLVDPETADRMDADENYMDADAPEYDALEGDSVDVGEIVAQTVAISMNPYPRAAGVSLSVENKKNISINEPELERENPFAALGKLKDES